MKSNESRAEAKAFIHRAVAMNTRARLATGLLAALAATLAFVVPAHADGIVGTSLPAGFPVILDASLGKPLIGFGAAGPVQRTPVVFVHGNNDTPFATACNPYGRIHEIAQHLADHGYAMSELWGIGYQGDQCDLLADQTLRAGPAHTTAANVADLRRFVQAVLRYTGAREVDIVGHSLGVVLAREWLRQDKHAEHRVRRIVAIDGANHGIINCSPSPLNYWQLPANGGYTPTTALCHELGSPRSAFLAQLNGDGEELDDVEVLVVRASDTGVVYFPTQDGVFPGVPAMDSFGTPTDFSRSASLKGAREIDLAGQGIYDPIFGTTHLGILNSPDTRKATFEFLTARGRGHRR
jgi:pimeloyl-ACP methyl ester carboxylesterase